MLYHLIHLYRGEQSVVSRLTLEIVGELERKLKELSILPFSNCPYEIIFSRTNDPMVKFIGKISQCAGEDMIKEGSLRILLRSFAQMHAKHRPDYTERLQACLDLVAYLNENLKNVKIYITGREEMDIFIAGRSNGTDYILLRVRYPGFKF